MTKTLNYWVKVVVSMCSHAMVQLSGIIDLTAYADAYNLYVTGVSQYS